MRDMSVSRPGRIKAGRGPVHAVIVWRQSAMVEEMANSRSRRDAFACALHCVVGSEKLPD